MLLGCFRGLRLWLDAKIAAQTERLRQLKEQKSKAERRARAAAQKRERQRDTRRKILLGALWMQELKNGDAAVLEKAKAKLDTFLKRDADRELFGLPPLNPSEPFRPTEFGED